MRSRAEAMAKLLIAKAGGVNEFIASRGGPAPKDHTPQGRIYTQLKEAEARVYQNQPTDTHKN